MRPFIIAEAGVNHNGSMNNAAALIAWAKWAGADAVKFQHYDAGEQVQRYTDSGEINDDLESALYDCEFSIDQMVTLKQIADGVGIEFMCTPFNAIKARELDDAKLLKRFKIGSGQIAEIGMIDMISESGLPTILSLGRTNDEWTARALGSLLTVEVTLLYCISKYPTPDIDVKLREISKLETQWGKPVGFSDHTIGIWASVAAAMAGACVIEKHFTTDRGLAGPDHKCSLEPAEFKHMVDQIRAMVP